MLAPSSLAPIDLLAQDAPALLVLTKLRHPQPLEQLRAIALDRQFYPDAARAVEEGWLPSADGRRLLCVVDRRIAPDAIDPHDPGDDASFVRAVRGPARPGHLRIVYLLPEGRGHAETTLGQLKAEATAALQARANEAG